MSGTTAISDNERLLTPANVRERYQRCDRTLCRWEKHGFPAPYRMNGRRFWKLSELVEFEQRRLKK